MARRKRSDSADAAVSAMKAAQNTIEPPEYLNVPEDAMPFWYDIIETRHLESWTPNDLIMAANLARIHRDIEAYSALSSNPRLSKVDSRVRVSPIHRVLKDLTDQASSLSRSLQVHARATQGEARDQQKRNAAYQHAQQVQKNIDGDDLIAKPLH